MSFSSNDIYNAGGPGSSAEPSMEEILASIRRILKEDDTIKSAPVDLDDDVLVLDQSMIAKPADLARLPICRWRCQRRNRRRSHCNLPPSRCIFVRADPLRRRIYSGTRGGGAGIAAAPAGPGFHGAARDAAGNSGCTFRAGTPAGGVRAASRAAAGLSGAPSPTGL